MEHLDPARLQAFLDLLVESGVEEFEGFNMHIRFTTSLFTKDKEVASDGVPMAPMEERQAHTIWEQPELWPGGKPPSFPKRER